MHILVGLGNPGPKYALNRHNIGFMLMDVLAQHLGAEFREEPKALVAKARHTHGGESHDLLLVKPQTFMNLSGEAVLPLMTFYKASHENLIVAHDEVDLPFGVVRMQKNRGHGGNNGIRNIHQHLGPDYARLKMGVGRPANPQMDVAAHVLQNFAPEEMQRLPDFLQTSANALLMFSEIGFLKAQNQVNTAGPRADGTSKN